MSKLNRVLAVALALQIVILAVVYWPESSVASGEPLYAGLEADQIVALTIRDATGAEVRLAKGPAGWGLPDAGDFPVEEGKVEELLNQIVGLRADRLVTRTAESHARLQVAEDEFQRRIEFELEDGTRHELYLGSSPSFNVLHVRPGDRGEVYLALGVTVSDAGTTPASWINPTYFSVPQDEIVGLTLENGNGQFQFEKDDGGNWTMLNLPAGETLLENNVTSLVTRISSVRMTRPLGREEDASYGLDDPSARVTAVTRDAEGHETTYVLRVGASLEGENGYVVKSATSPYYVLVAGFSVQDLIERTMQDFIEVPPTPGPTEPDVTPTP
jgi:hypothetical protein